MYSKFGDNCLSTADVDYPNDEGEPTITVMNGAVEQGSSTNGHADFDSPTSNVLHILARCISLWSIFIFALAIVLCQYTNHGAAEENLWQRQRELTNVVALPPPRRIPASEDVVLLVSLALFSFVMSLRTCFTATDTNTSPPLATPEQAPVSDTNPTSNFHRLLLVGFPAVAVAVGGAITFAEHCLSSVGLHGSCGRAALLAALFGCLTLCQLLMYASLRSSHVPKTYVPLYGEATTVAQLLTGLLYVSLTAAFCSPKQPAVPLPIGTIPDNRYCSSGLWLAIVLESILNTVLTAPVMLFATSLSFWIPIVYLLSEVSPVNTTDTTLHPGATKEVAHEWDHTAIRITRQSNWRRVVLWVCIVGNSTAFALWVFCSNTSFEQDLSCQQQCIHSGAPLPTIEDRFNGGVVHHGGLPRAVAAWPITTAGAALLLQSYSPVRWGTTATTTGVAVDKSVTLLVVRGGHVVIDAEGGAMSQYDTATSNGSGNEGTEVTCNDEDCCSRYMRMVGKRTRYGAVVSSCSTCGKVFDKLYCDLIQCMISVSVGVYPSCPVAAVAIRSDSSTAVGECTAEKAYCSSSGLDDARDHLTSFNASQMRCGSCENSSIRSDIFRSHTGLSPFREFVTILQLSKESRITFIFWCVSTPLCVWCVSVVAYYVLLRTNDNSIVLAARLSTNADVVSSSSAGCKKEVQRNYKDCSVVDDNLLSAAKSCQPLRNCSSAGCVSLHQDFRNESKCFEGWHDDSVQQRLKNYKWRKVSIRKLYHIVGTVILAAPLFYNTSAHSPPHCAFAPVQNNSPHGTAAKAAETLAQTCGAKYDIAIQRVVVAFTVFGCTAAFTVFGFVELLRISDFPRIGGNAINKLLQRYLHPSEVMGLCLPHFYLLLSLALPLAAELFVTAGCRGDLDMLALSAGFLSCGLGDSAAAIVGAGVGRRHWCGTDKTMEGSFAYIVAYASGAALIVSVLHPPVGHTTTLLLQPFTVALTVALVSALYEGFSTDADNLRLGTLCWSLHKFLSWRVRR